MNTSKTPGSPHKQAPTHDLFTDDLSAGSSAPESSAQEPGGAPANAAADPAPSSESHQHEASFGQRLQAAREVRCLDVATCGQALHLSPQVLRKLETDDYAGMESMVYLRSYLTKYGRFLDLPEGEIEGHLATLQLKAPQLVSTGGIGRSRYLLQRYATAATYFVLTAAIVVPIVWMGLRGGLNHEAAKLAPLDAAPVGQHPAARAAAATPQGAGLSASAATQAAAEAPLQASMAPFDALDSDAAGTPKVATRPVVDGVDSHTLTLSLPVASWVSVTRADGKRLEYGLLDAGAKRTYRSSVPLKVSIGDADDAEVRVDGKPVDIQPFQRAHVAHFRVEMDDETARLKSF